MWRHCITSFLLFSVTSGMQKTGTKNKKQEQKHRTVVKIELEIPYGVCVYWCGGRTCLYAYILIRHYNTSGISRISFRVSETWCCPWNVLFEQFPCLHAGVLVLLATHFKVGLQLIGNDLAAFLAINPTGTSNNTDRVSYDTLCTYYRPVLFYNQ